MQCNTAENDNRHNNKEKMMKMTTSTLRNHQTTTKTATSSATTTPTKEFDDLVSTKLKDLSIQERSDGLYDLHGVSELPEENAEMIQERLVEMNHALNVMTITTATATAASDSNVAARTTTTTTAYKQAVMKSPTYVEKLKIPCLRAEEYNSQDAARRLIRYFDRKMELFGEEKLVESIKIKDLDDKDIEALERGFFQILPQRDRAGRAIVFVHGGVSVLYETKTVMRVMFYMCMSALHDEETQRRGIVIIYYGVNQKTIVQGRTRQYWKNWISIPWRVAASHFCIESNTALSDGAVLLFRIMKNKTVCRARVHPGTAMEIIYTLMTFGITKDSLPIDVDDKLDLTSHHSMLHILKCREEQSLYKNATTISNLKTSATTTDNNDDENNSSNASMILENNFSSSTTTTTTFPSGDFSSSTTTSNNNDSNGAESSSPSSPSPLPILIPNPMDVLMGRGRHPKSRPGSLRLQNLLLKYRETYEKASRYDKTEIAEIVLNEMKASGSRFLAWGSSDVGYMECTDCVARDKISHGFRNLRLKNANNNNNNNKNNSSSSTMTTTTTTLPGLSSRRVVGTEDNVVAVAATAEAASNNDDNEKNMAITNDNDRRRRKRSFGDNKNRNEKEKVSRET